MDVIKIEAGGEGGICRTSKEVQTSVSAEDGVALLDNGLYRRENENVVIAVAARKLAEDFYGVFTSRSVEINEPDAVSSFAARSRRALSISVTTRSEGFLSQ